MSVHTLPDIYRDATIEELLTKRKEILARPFPKGYSGDERQMMDCLEEHCTDNFMRMLEALKDEHAELIEENDAQHLIGECQTCKLIAELEEVK